MPFSKFISRFGANAEKGRCSTSGPNSASLEGKLVLKYFGLGNMGGRGGVVRLMLYIHGVEFEDVKIVPDASWMTLKEELISSGDNPCGGLPVLYIQDKPYFNHIAILKFLAAKLNVAPSDPDAEYRSNVLVDEYATWRSDWAAMIFDDEKRKEYMQTKREKIYELIERLYAMRVDKTTPYFIGQKQPGYDDLCVFQMMFDDRQFCGVMNLDAYPALKAMYEKVSEIPIIANWCKEAEAATPPPAPH